MLPHKRRAAAVQAFEADRVDAVLEHKTYAEWWELLGASARTGGLTLSALARYDPREPGKDEPMMEIEYDPVVLDRVVRRIELRQRLGLSHRDCVVDDPPAEADHCRCLSETLDSLIDSGPSSATVLKAARRTHRERWAWLKRKSAPRPESVAKPRYEPRPKPIPRPRSEAGLAKATAEATAAPFPRPLTSALAGATRQPPWNTPAAVSRAR
jgi:hypothetical protein